MADGQVLVADYIEEYGTGGAEMYLSNVYFDLPIGLFTSITNVQTCPSNDSGRWLCCQAGAINNTEILIAVLRNASSDFDLGANISVKGTWK